MNRICFAVLCVSAVAYQSAWGQESETTIAVVARREARNDPLTIRSEKHLVNDFAPRADGGLINAVVEIPAGTNAKWEVDHHDGHLKWEIKNAKPRVVNFLPYPGNYGMIPRTLLSKEKGGDGDPLDVLILGPAVQRGTVQKVRIIGVLKLLDGGEQDDKLLAVLPGAPLGDVHNLAELNERFPGVLEIAEIWMTSYKGPGEMVSQGFKDAERAAEILQKAIDAYAAH